MSKEQTFYRGWFDLGTISVLVKDDILNRRRKRFQQTVKKTYTDKDELLYNTRISINGTETGIVCIEEDDVPLFFETTTYKIHICLEQEIVEHKVIHPLITVENAFQSFDKVLQGNIDFQNNIGLFELVIKVNLKETGWKTINLSFWVYPTKMDLHSDYQIMTDTLIKDDPLGMYNLLALTKIERSTASKYQDNEAVWYSHFLRLKAQLMTNLSIIVQSPHYTFIDHPTYVRADRISKRLSNKLAERITEDLQQDIFDKKYRVNKRIKMFDTIENQFVKHTIESIVSKIDSLQHTILKKTEGDSKAKKTPNSEQQSNFTVELGKQQEDFHTFLYQPFFRQITEYHGMTSLSLVLQEKTGYAGFYRDWIQFQMMLDMWEDSNGIGIKTIDQIYERWCFLEVSKYLGKILGVLSGGEELIPKVFDDKKEHRFTVVIEENDFTFTLYDNKEYSNSTNIHTLVRGTRQRPDITMKMRTKNVQLFWLFDAKYRIDNNSSITNEIPPKDAFDQMHRYRDALFIKTKEGDKPLPILGAYILFPGILENDYYSASIEKTGVGAFSMLPKSVKAEPSRLYEFLEKKITSLTQSTLDYKFGNSDILYVEEPVRIPYLSTMNTELLHNVLVVTSSSMKNREEWYQEKFKKGKADFYHMAAKAVFRLEGNYLNIVQRTQFLAIAHYSNEKFCIQHIYPVHKVYLKKRAALTKEQTGIEKSFNTDDTLYWCFELKQSISKKEPLFLDEIEGHNLYWMDLSDLLSKNELPKPLR